MRSQLINCDVMRRQNRAAGTKCRGLLVFRLVSLSLQDCGVVVGWVDGNGNVHGCRILCVHKYDTLRRQTWYSAPPKTWYSPSTNMIICADKHGTLCPQTWYSAPKNMTLCVHKHDTLRRQTWYSAPPKTWFSASTNMIICADKHDNLRRQTWYSAATNMILCADKHDTLRLQTW